MGQIEKLELIIEKLEKRVSALEELIKNSTLSSIKKEPSGIKYLMCPNCNGTGWIDVPDSTAVQTVCKNCFGTGQIPQVYLPR